MLVLTRKTDEAIRIGEVATVIVCEIKQGKVRLGVVAPGEPVRRDEMPPSVSALRQLFARRSDEERAGEMLEWISIRLQLASETMGFEAFEQLIAGVRDLAA